MKAENVLTASYDWDDSALETDSINGLNEAIEHVAETHEKTLVRCEDRVADYDVYWNEKTESVRVAAVVVGASWEVPNDE